MGGKFTFQLTNPNVFDKDKYRTALRGLKKLKAPPGMYASYGPEDVGQGLVVKVHRRPDWTLVLPLDPIQNPLECGFTHGVVSRRGIWAYIRTVLCTVCAACPWAFEFKYEDRDLLGDFAEVGEYDYHANKFVVRHLGLPTAEELEHQARMLSSKSSPAILAKLEKVPVPSSKSVHW